MGLTHRITHRRDIPHEPEQWMVLRHLSGRQLEDAARQKMVGFMQHLKLMGRDSWQQLREVQPEQPQAEAEVEEPDVLLSYDVDTVLRHGIVEWSYDEPVSLAAIDELDKTTRDWAVRELLAISLVRSDLGKGAG